MQYRRPPALFRWSTDDVPAAQRFDYFAEALSSALAPMQIESDARARLAASMTGVDLGPLTIVHQTGTGHRSYRHQIDLARSGEHTFHLIVNSGAAWDIEHRGRVRLRPGDALLADSNYGHRIDIRSDFNLFHLKLSEGWVHHWLGDPTTWVGRHIASDSGWGQTLSSFVRTLSPEFVLRSGATAAIGEHLGALLSLTGGDLMPSGASVLKGDAALRSSIKDGIWQRCGEPGLSAADIAQALAVDAREIHRCLSAHGESFASLLFAARCAVVHRLLNSRQFRHLPFRAIVARAGLPPGANLTNLSDRFASDRGIVEP